ncbi:MAG: transglutaminase domain-containing protein [Pseudanabaena sp. ELA607]
MSKRRNPKFSSQRKSDSAGYGALWLLICFTGAVAISGKFPNLTALKPLDSLGFGPFQRPSPLLEETLTENLAQQHAQQQYQNRDIGNAAQLQKQNFAAIDRISLGTKYQGTSVTELANFFKQYAKTDAEKARIIYTWIARNIAYDAPAFQKRQNSYYSPEEVLQHRLAVCAGYANLYQALGKAMGLEVVTVQGFAKGVDADESTSERPNHAWNAVKIDGSWYLVDVTWGAGSLHNGRFQRQFKPIYFATQPSQLIYTHRPQLDLWQMLREPYDRSRFLALPRLTPEFFRLGLALVDANQYRLRANTGRAMITLKAPANIMFQASLKQQNRSLAQTQTFVQRNGDRAEINLAFPAAGTYQLEIYAKPKGTAKDVNPSHQQMLPLVATYEISATQAGTAFPKTYLTHAEQNAYLYTPVAPSLPRNQTAIIEIRVPNALDVAAIDQKTNEWKKLTKKGDRFVGLLQANGSVSISAKFADGDQYWSLVTYE